MQNKVSILWCDYLSVVSLSASFVLHFRTKHLEIELYFVRENVLMGSLSVQHVPSIDRIVNIFTKSLFVVLFHRLQAKLNVLSPTTLT